MPILLIWACCEYGQLPRSIVFALKYHGRTDIGRTVGTVMHDRMEALRRETGLMYDLILPVPMYPEKERIRGYNQASVIGKHFARLEGMPFRSDVLQRSQAPLRGDPGGTAADSFRRNDSAECRGHPEPRCASH